MQPPERATIGTSAGGPWFGRPLEVRRLLPADVAQCDAGVRQLLVAAREGGVCLDLLWGAVEEDGQVHSAALVLPQAGRTGMVFTSRPTRRREIAELAAVIDAATRNLPPERVSMAQVLLAPDENLAIEAFAEAGFTRLANLGYMEARVPAKAVQPAARPGITLEAYEPGLEADFVAVLEASYQQTLDCPGLQGMRRTADVLAGHKAAGQFDAALWTLLRIQGEPAGALLLNPIPAGGYVELVYVGLAPKARGGKIGSLLMAHGMWLCSRRKERTMTLAVDEANAPALKLYRRFGFTRTAQRVAMIRAVGGAAAKPAGA
jgi:mycothiol synthase